MIDAGEGLAGTFSDIAELISRCRFADCTHGNEPGCAVRQALADGSLSAERWETYRRLEEESNWSKRLKNERNMKISMQKRKMSRQKT